MRLQVFLSNSGLCSRRKAFDLVQSGKVKVNDYIIKEPSYSIDQSRDIVEVDGQRVNLKEKTYIILNKPRGVTTTKKDPFATKTVMDLLPDQYQHLFPVGRLDKETTGLLILTNDGDLSHKLTHPSFEIDKVYIAKLDRPLNKDHKIKLQKGVLIEGEKTSPCKIVELNNKNIKIIIHEGKKRQIRKMLEIFKYKAISLERISFGCLNIGNLAIGKWRQISNGGLIKLKNITER
ncbi:MAG: pseudouridine synthase [Candidatus Omnitrophota bacterium]